MRWLVILLLLANVAFWAYNMNTRVEQKALEERPEPARVIADDVPRLQLLQEADILPELREETEQQGTEETDAVAVKTVREFPLEEVASEQSEEGAETESQLCYRYGPLPDKESLKTVTEWMDPLQYQYGTYRTEKSREKQFWIYLEPLESQASARARLEEFRQQGIKDTALITRGDLKNAISLGVFRNQDSVNRRLAEIEEQGDRPVVVPHYEIVYEYWLYWHAEELEAASNALDFDNTNPLDQVERQETDCQTIAKRLEAQ